MEKRIGASYSSKNRKEVDCIDRCLNEFGLKLIRYDFELEIKDNIQEFMDSLIECDVILLMLSKEYFNSLFCLYELATLLNNSKEIIVVYLEKEEPIEVLMKNVLQNIEKLNVDQLFWGKSRLAEVDFEEIITVLAHKLTEKYLTYAELITQRGIRQLLKYLNYTPDQYLKYLDEILEIENFYEREKCFAEFLEIAPANDIYNYYKAISYEKQGYIQGAIFFLKQAILLNATYMLAHVKLLDLALKYPQEIELEEEMLTRFDMLTDLSKEDKIIFWKAKGLLLFRKAKKADNTKKNMMMQEALHCFNEARIFSDNQDATVFNNMGLAYETLGEFNKAIESYHRAIELSPRYYQALNNLALIYQMHSGEIELSRRLYEECLKIKPDYAPARGNYALLMEKIDINCAIEMDLRILVEPHEYTDFVMNLAVILEEERISDKLAESIYKILLEKKPGSFSAMYNMANYLRRSGANYDKVMQYLKPVYIAMPYNDMVLFTFALLELRENCLDSAIGYCNKALKYNFDYIPAIFLKSYIEEKQGMLRTVIIANLEKRVVNIELVDKDEKELFALVYNLLYILNAKEGSYECAEEWHKKAVLANESFKDKKNINEPYYGMDILEYKFTHVSQGRINKTRIENFMLDNHEQNKARLLQILDKIG